MEQREEPLVPEERYVTVERAAKDTYAIVIAVVAIIALGTIVALLFWQSHNTALLITPDASGTTANGTHWTAGAGRTNR